MSDRRSGRRRRGSGGGEPRRDETACAGTGERSVACRSPRTGAGAEQRRLRWQGSRHDRGVAGRLSSWPERLRRSWVSWPSPGSADAAPETAPDDDPDGEARRRPRDRPASKLSQARAQLAQGNFDTAEALARGGEAAGTDVRRPRGLPRQGVARHRAPGRGSRSCSSSAARSSLARNEYDKAEKFARSRPTKASSLLTFPVWGDTPLVGARRTSPRRGRRTTPVAGKTGTADKKDVPKSADA